MRRAGGVCVLSAAILLAGGARGDEKAACVAAAEKAQQLRTDGKLREARAALHLCARETCPSIVRTDCTQWLAEVESSQPTIVLRAQNARGQDLVDVRVQLDGEPLGERLDGLPIEVDPGQHVLTCDRVGSKKLRQDIVIRTGDRNRSIAFVLEDVDPPPPSGVPAVPPVAPEHPMSPPHVAAWVLAGTALAAAGAWGYFGLRGRAEVSDMRSECVGHCSADRVQHAKTQLLAADISLGTAVVSAGLSTLLFFSGSQKTSASHEPPARELGVAPVPGGISASWTQRF